MKILAFSDVHCDHAACEALVVAAAEADLVIGAGDFAQRREGLAETMAILEPIADKAVYVAGNNETPEELRAATSAEVLHGQMVERLGLKIYGLGGAIPELNITAFESFDIPEAEAAPLLGAADGADIIICHSPPKGLADVMASRGSMGSVEIRSSGCSHGLWYVGMCMIAGGSAVKSAKQRWQTLGRALTGSSWSFE